MRRRFAKFSSPPPGATPLATGQKNRDLVPTVRDRRSRRVLTAAAQLGANDDLLGYTGAQAVTGDGPRALHARPLLLWLARVRELPTGDALGHLVGHNKRDFQLPSLADGIRGAHLNGVAATGIDAGRAKGRTEA